MSGDWDRHHSWKPILLQAAGFGAGVGVVTLLAVGSLNWYVTRPTVAKPWNRDAITAKYSDLYLKLEQQNALDRIAPKKNGRPVWFTFRYTIQNNSERDYVLPSADDLYRELADGKGLERDSSLNWVGGTSIPSGQSVNVGIQIEYEYAQGTSELDEALKDFANRRIAEMEGFVALDLANRYEIRFAKPPKLK